MGSPTNSKILPLRGEDYMRHLERSAAIVDSWPEWKKGEKSARLKGGMMPKPDPEPTPQVGAKRLTNILCPRCRLPLRESYVRATDSKGKFTYYWLTLPHCNFRMTCPPRENR